jgi:hypothetical protein
MTQQDWKAAEELMKRHDQGGGAWLRLQNDGDKAVVVFLGPPLSREVCFVDGKYAPYDDAARAQGLKPTLRVALNVALYETREAKVLEQGVMFFKDLIRVRDKYGIDKWAFEIQRHGGPKDPKTTYSILPERQLSPEEMDAFRALPTKDLRQLYHTREARAATGAGAAATLPVSAAAPASAPTAALEPKFVEALTGKLKVLPRASVDRFLDKFAVQRVRDLPPAQFGAACAFVDALVRELQPAEVAVDPFA